jgi:NAD(P)-dependent dehydrogenase (short-subunit alcohol dehydrogenase family)
MGAHIDVNLTGVFLCAQAQAQHMTRQDPIEGKIINIASLYGSVAGGVPLCGCQ